MEASDDSNFECYLRLKFPKFSKGYKASDFNGFIEEHIGRDKVRSLGRLAFPNEWQIQISDNDIREKLIKMRKTKINNRSCWIFPLNFSEIRGFIHWLPNTVSNTEIEHFLRNYGRVLFVKNENQEMVGGENNESGSRYFGLFMKPECSKESLPHFWKINGFLGLINIWGRVSACFFCKEVGHQKIDCAKFKEKLRDYSQRPQKDSSTKRRKPRGLRHVVRPEEYKNHPSDINHEESNYSAIESKNISSNLSEEIQMLGTIDDFPIEPEVYFDQKVFQEFLEKLKYILTDELNTFHSCIKNTLLETTSKTGRVESVNNKIPDEFQSHNLFPAEKPEGKDKFPQDTMEIFFSTLRNKLENIGNEHLRPKIIALCEQFQSKYKEETPLKALSESMRNSDEGMLKIMEQIGNLEIQNVDKIASIAVAAKLSEADLDTIIAELRNICQNIRKIIIEKLSFKTTGTETSAEIKNESEYFKTVAEKTKSLMTSLENSSLTIGNVIQKTSERIAYSENQTLEQLFLTAIDEQLNEAELSSRIAQLCDYYKKLRTTVYEVLSMKVIENHTAQSEEKVENIKSVTDEIGSVTVSLEESLKSNSEFQQGIMEKIDASYLRNVEKIRNATDLSEAHRDVRITEISGIYETLRKELNEKLSLVSTGTDTSLETLELREIAKTVAEKIGNLLVSLEKSPITIDGFIEKILERIASSEQRKLEQLFFTAIDEQLNDAELSLRIAQLCDHYNKLRTVYEVLSMKVIEIRTAQSVEKVENMKSVTDEIGSAIVSSEESSQLSSEFQQGIMEKLDASYLRNVEKIWDTTELSEAHRTTRIIEMRKIYDMVRKELNKKLSLKSIDSESKTCRPKTVEASEIVKSIAEEVGSLIVRLQKVSFSGHCFLKRIMGRMAISENRNLEKITHMAVSGELSATELVTRLSLFRNIYEELRKRIINKLLMIYCETYSYGELINGIEVATVITEEIGGLITSLQERPISSSDFTHEVMKQITVYENQYLENIASISASADIDLIELFSSTLPFRNIFKELRETVIEILSPRTAQTGISVEAEVVIARTVVEEISGLIVNLQGNLNLSERFQQITLERIALSENLDLEKTACMAVSAMRTKEELIPTISQLNSMYDELRKTCIEEQLQKRFTSIDTRVELVEGAHVDTSVCGETGNLTVSMEDKSVPKSKNKIKSNGTSEIQNPMELMSEKADARLNADFESRASQVRNIYKKLRKEIDEKLLQKTTKTGTYTEPIANEISSAVTEEIESLISLLDEKEVSVVSTEILKWIAVSENRSVDKIISMESAARISESEFSLRLSQVKSIYEELRKRIIKMLSIETISNEACAKTIETPEFAKAVATQIGSMVASLENSSISVDGFQNKIMQLIGDSENKLLEKIMLAEGTVQPSKEELSFKISLVRSFYEDLKKEVKNSLKTIDIAQSRRVVNGGN